MSAPVIHPSILTRSGVYFNYLTGNNVVLIDDISHALANICRFGGHTREFYSVAQHCVLASNIVPEQDALWALLHDAAEAYVGDMTRPLKELLPGFKEIEKRVERELFDIFGLQGEMPASVKHADLVLLATERRDLMPEQIEPWGLLDGIEPLAEIIDDPWPPRHAAYEFRIRFGEIVLGMTGGRS